MNIICFHALSSMTSPNPKRQGGDEIEEARTLATVTAVRRDERSAATALVRTPSTKAQPNLSRVPEKRRRADKAVEIPWNAAAAA
ncbi:hypothetical protein HPB50_017680 [Hyalomma asiaticum]|uniref:Uncharacterized protein n=1 Tax=Hyalomma asiaticum TaxID=266040 RepID=A0ACB7SM41_HYAAI|nr:hypothetical protein HPB50_017680 [Hyalomma asiaticum]